MKRWDTISCVLNVLGSLIVIQGFLLLLPLIFVCWNAEFADLRTFLVPSAASFIVGIILHKTSRPRVLCSEHADLRNRLGGTGPLWCTALYFFRGGGVYGCVL